MTPNSDIALAVRRALFMSAVAATGASTVPSLAQAQETQDQPAADEQRVETVTVTGSRIRRVDEETAAPVFVLDAAQIQSSGVTTLGDLIQRVPAISGAATNPQVNNGGGTGETNVELRGLGAQRTLVLLDGKRLGVLGANGTVSAVDVNLIPINLIERVEILKEGAGAVYGSDAIAGVVNFITRKDVDGAEVNAQFGKTSESDGETRSVSVLWGNSASDKLNVLFGGNYNKQEEVSAGARDFSKFALYLYGGAVTQGGSSRTANGRINLPGDNGDGTFVPGSLADQFQCGSVTRTGAGDDPSDYRCFGLEDLYNYQPFNLLVTPQERGNLFTSVNYQINDKVSTFAQIVYNHTQSGYQIAPLPFDATSDDTIVAANSLYNPFGIAFGGISGDNPNLRTRMEAAGTRHNSVATDQIFTNAGLKGALGGNWQWELSAGLGHMDQDTNTSGYLVKSLLEAAVGPSGFDATGNPVCGVPDANGIVAADDIVANCIPLNIFSPNDPSQAAALGQIATNYQQNYSMQSQSYGLNLNGKLLDMPAGELQAAIGAEYQKQRGAFETDVLTRGIPPLFLTCQLAGETCTGDSAFDYNSKDFFGEVFVPLLKDMPAVKSLNLTAGIRYTDYSTESIGSSTNSEFKLEYRPFSDLMVRGSFAEVFRAPTLLDLSKAPTQDAPTFTDPCTNLTSAQLAANPNLQIACVGVAPDTNFSQDNGQITGLIVGTPTLKPETGDVLTYGLVYDSSQIRGLSMTLDFWKYKIDDLITALDVNFAANQCVQTGSPQFCGLIFRYPSGENGGQILEIQEPIVNLGKLKTDGFDFGIKYSVRDTRIGSFNVSLDTTRINSYENTPAPGAVPVEVAGTYDRQFGNFAKWRGLLSVGWSFHGFDGLLSTRYIHKLELKDPDGLIDLPPLQIPSITYVDLTLGYNFPTNTRVQIGAINIGDKQPPLLYQNNVINANTDVSTYDTIGRRWWVGVTQKF